MKPVIEPSEEIKERAINRYHWKDSSDFLLNQEKTVGLLVTLPFSPIKYLGTTTILSHKIKRKNLYSFLGNIYRGELLKLALKILEKKRVRVFVFLDTKWNHAVLMFGTKEGTVGIAPRDTIESAIPLIDLTRKSTNKFKRGIIFLSICKKPRGKRI